MSKKTAYIIMVIYGVTIVLPPLVYLLVNFYMYLFDGWLINAKFNSAFAWVSLSMLGYVIINPYMMRASDDQ